MCYPCTMCGRCGKFDPDCYVAYLEKKFTEVYDL